MLGYRRKRDPCTFLRQCARLFLFDTLAEKTTHLVPEFAMFELVFSLGKPQKLENNCWVQSYLIIAKSLIPKRF